MQPQHPLDEMTRILNNVRGIDDKAAQICWNACTKFECEDKYLMQKYRVLMGETE